MSTADKLLRGSRAVEKAIDGARTSLELEPGTRAFDLSREDLLAALEELMLEQEHQVLIPIHRPEHIREIRHNGGLTLAQMAAIMGVSPIRVDKLELGQFPANRGENQRIDRFRKTVALAAPQWQRTAWARALAELALRAGPEAAALRLAAYAGRWK